MSEFAAVRHNMVECQLRTNKVTNWRLIDAMDDVPRELFVPKQLADVAYRMDRMIEWYSTEAIAQRVVDKWGDKDGRGG